MPLTLEMPTELGAAGEGTLDRGRDRRSRRGGTGTAGTTESARRFVRWVETWAL